MAVSLEDLQKKYPQLSEDLLGREVSEEHVREIARINSIEHEVLGAALGLNPEEMGQGKQPKLLALQVLRRWKKKLAFKATYRVLIEALLKWEIADYARDIFLFLVQSASSEQPSVSAGHSASHHDTTTSSDGAQHASLSGVKTTLSSIAQLQSQFNDLKSATRMELEKAGVSLDSVVDKITSLPAKKIEPHREFLFKYTEMFHKCKSISEVFSHLNTHWDYLNYDMLVHLISGFSLSCLYAQQKDYEQKVEHFLTETSLEQFSEVKDEVWFQEPPIGFKNAVLHLNWTPSTSLKEIDMFRQTFAHEYGLRACAIFLHSMRSGSIIISMLVPESLEEMIKSTKRVFFEKHGIVSFELNDNIIYHQSDHKPQKELRMSEDKYFGGKWEEEDSDFGGEWEEEVEHKILPLYHYPLDVHKNLMVEELKTQRELFGMCKERGVIYAGSTDDPDACAGQHERKGFSGTLYYAKTRNMKQAEDKLLAKRSYRHNTHKTSNQDPEPGYIYLIKGKQFS